MRLFTQLRSLSLSVLVTFRNSYCCLYCRIQCISLHLVLRLKSGEKEERLEPLLLPVISLNAQMHRVGFRELLNPKGLFAAQHIDCVNLLLHGVKRQFVKF